MNRVEPQEPLPPSPPLPSPELGDSWLTHTAHDRSCPRVWTGRRVDVLRASCPCPQVTARTRSFYLDRQDMPSPAICRASWRETLQRAVTFQQSEGRTKRLAGGSTPNPEIENLPALTSSTIFSIGLLAHNEPPGCPIKSTTTLVAKAIQPRSRCARPWRARGASASTKLPSRR